MLVTLVLLFALSGNANALTLSWEFINTPYKAGPTDMIYMMAKVTAPPSSGNAATFNITGFQAISINDGTLIYPSGPYSIQLNSGPFTPFSAYGGSAYFTFGTLTPMPGPVPVGTYISGPAVAQFTYSGGSLGNTTVLGMNVFAVNVVPEPSTMLLLGSGLAGLGFFRWRRKRGA